MIEMAEGTGFEPAIELEPDNGLASRRLSNEKPDHAATNVGKTTVSGPGNSGNSGKGSGFAPALNPAQKKPLLTEQQIVAASEPTSGVKCGIYFLIKDGKVKYVGQSINIDARVGHHHYRRFDRWYWIPCEQKELNATERAYLNMLLPEWNTDFTTVTMREKLAPQPDTPLADIPFTGVSREVLEACLAENREYAERHWTEDAVMRERLRRARAKRRGQDSTDFGPMPQPGDLRRRSGGALE